MVIISVGKKNHLSLMACNLEYIKHAAGLGIRRGQRQKARDSKSRAVGAKAAQMPGKICLEAIILGRSAHQEAARRRVVVFQFKVARSEGSQDSSLPKAQPPVKSPS